jgi:transposase
MTTKKEKNDTRTARRAMSQLSIPRTPAVGLDLGEAFSVATMYSVLGEISERFNFSMDDAGYALFSSRIPKDARIGYEASTMAYPVNRRLRAMGYQNITVAHPKELALIVRSKKKNDRADSEKIARLLFMDMLPESHLLSREEQILRDLLIQRVKLGVEIARTKSSVISYLKREDVYATLPKANNNFSAARREAIRSIRFGDDRDLVLKTMMEKIAFYEERCAPLEERTKALVKDNEDVKLLMTIPGVDYYLAALFSSYVRDVNRFPTVDHLASFFGIIPETRDSANVKRRGRMSKDGPSIARWTLGIMTDTVMHWNPHLHRYYVHQKERTKSGKRAHVLAMKKLLRMTYHVLKTREHWRWENEALTNKKLEGLERGGGGVA